MSSKRNPYSAKFPPFETEDLRKNLVRFLSTKFDDPESGKSRGIGTFTWGVYAFFDYDGEPIYVGQTKEKISTRIRRHLTNQRTDAVAMSVLDPFEVYEVEVWPLPQFEMIKQKTNPTGFKAASHHLDALEALVHKLSIEKSIFGAILNEKDPPPPAVKVTLSPSFRMKIVSDDVHKIRSHPDFRIARRALIISRLAQVISERKVQCGLRRTLLTQAKRLQWLAQQRFDGVGVTTSSENDDQD